MGALHRENECWAELSPEAGSGNLLGAAFVGCHWEVLGGAVRYRCHPGPVQRTDGCGEAEVSAKMP